MRALDLGGPKLYWLDGGGFRLDGGSMFGPVPRSRWAPLYPPADDNSVPLTAHVLLVEMPGAGWGLIDAGFGHHLTDRQRRAYTLERETQLDQSLAELGLSPSRIDWVVLSHLHLDHAGGVFGEGGAPVFPNARIVVQSLEAREARDASNRAHGMYTGDAFDRLEALQLVHEVDGEAEVVPGVRVFLTGGHSRGHQATLISGSTSNAASVPTGAAGSVPARAAGSVPTAGAGSAAVSSGTSAALLHLGDLLVTQAHLPAGWVSALDDFPLDSIRAKREWLPRVAQNGWWVAFSHDVNAVAATLSADSKVQSLWP